MLKFTLIKIKKLKRIPFERLVLLIILLYSIQVKGKCPTLGGGQELDHVHGQIAKLNNVVSKLSNDEVISCSKDLEVSFLKAIQNEIYSSSPSLRMSFYQALDKVMYCDSKGKIKKVAKQKIIVQLELLKKIKNTPFIWADAKGVNVWKDEQPEIRLDLPFKLSQLNSSVIVFVPSEKDNQTTYNLEADLSLPIFSAWDRRKDLASFEEAEKEREDRILKELTPNFTRNYNHIEVSKIGIPDNISCYYLIEKEKIECGQDYSNSITHEISHLLETRYPNFFKTLLNAKGGHKDRLKKAQEIVPQFGITKCTLDSYEDHCSDGALTREEASKIAKASKIIQDSGSSAKRFYAEKISSAADESFCKTPLVKQDNQSYCVRREDSLYALVRNGEEYLQVLVDKAFNDKKQFENSASIEEKRLIALMKEYLY